MRSIICTASLLACLASPALAQETHARATTKPVVVEIHNSQDELVGTAALSSVPDGVRIKLDIKNLPPGQHSMHIHQVAKCDAPDFKTAGPHFNSAAHAHEGQMSGDIPNFFLIVADDHTAHVTVTAPNVTMAPDDDRSVFSNGGTALVIHAAEGGAPGSPQRIACGVIKKPS